MDASKNKGQIKDKLDKWIFTYGVAIRSISCFSVLFVVVHVVVL